MNASMRTHVALLLPLVVISCSVPKQADKDKSESADFSQILPEHTICLIAVNDHDPYFVESRAITSTRGPHSITRSILQDRNGHMWFATWEGIVGFDGNVFTNYMNADGLRRFHTFAVLEDSPGGLWFGTIGAGLYHYDGTSFVNFTTKEGLAYDRVLCLTEDSKGIIWIGTEKGISCYDGKVFRNLTAAEGLIDGDVNAIVEARDGRFWIATRGESYVYDGDTFMPITTQDGQTPKNFRTIIEDQKGDIWLGGQDGLWRYDGKIYTQHSTKFIGYLYETKDGRIWTSAEGTNGMSLYVLDIGSVSSGQDPLTSVLDLNGQVFGIVEDTNGDIWFGADDGTFRYDGVAFHRNGN
ncbi:MAG: ligand-binding sensor domain-containing protein [Glaciecola sp.]|jgi:ligand-binding sensor domain-containing protein